MPWIIDYPLVLEQMRALKLRSLYYNSGAFGFGAEAPVQHLGWIGPTDPSIRGEMRAFTRQVAEPYESTLAALLVRAWKEHLPGRIWVMPASHWAYELDFGSREWMPPLLEHIGIDPGLLQTRTNAAAIEFAPDETELLKHFVTRLLEMLQSSDFAIAFPHRRVVCSLHHHKQLWWTSAEPELGAALAQMSGYTKSEI